MDLQRHKPQHDRPQLSDYHAKKYDFQRLILYEDHQLKQKRCGFIKKNKLVQALKWEGTVREMNSQFSP